MNGVTGGVVGILPWGTTTFSQISTTVRRLSAGSASSTTATWCFVLNVGGEMCFKDVRGDCSRLEEGDTTGIFVLDDTLEPTGIGISDAFGNWGEDDDWIFAFVVLDFSDGVLGEDGEVGGLREEVELVGEDFVPIVLRGRGVGILDAALGDVTGVIFWTSFEVQFEVEVVDSSWRFVGTAATLAGGREELSATAESNDTEDELVIFRAESSFEAVWTFSSPPRSDPCSFANSLIFDDMVAVFVSLKDEESTLASVCSLGTGSFGLGSVSGGERRGGTLGLWYMIGRLVAGQERSVLELVTSMCACDCDLLVDSSPEVSAVP